MDSLTFRPFLFLVVAATGCSGQIGTSGTHPGDPQVGGDMAPGDSPKYGDSTGDAGAGGDDSAPGGDDAGGDDAMTADPLLPENVPIGATLLKSSHQKKGSLGDNWTLSWAADDSVLVVMDDGAWLHGNPTSADRFNHTLYRLKGGAYDFKLFPYGDSRADTDDVERVAEYPYFPFWMHCSFGYGVLAVDGTIYTLISQCPDGPKWKQYYAMKMLKSTDNGATWSRVNSSGSEEIQTIDQSDLDRYDSNEYFFYEDEAGQRSVDGQPYYPFTIGTFVQAGRDYQDRADQYIYVYSPVVNSDKTFDLELARAPIGSLEQRSNWEFFQSYNTDGSANWTSFGQRKSVLRYSGTGKNWYSYLPDVTYNKGLDLYIMVNSAIPDDEFNSYYASTITEPGSLHLAYSTTPYGPWTEFKKVKYFYAESTQEHAYQIKLDPKRISADGKEMVLIWSDSAGNFDPSNYSLHQMKVRIDVGPPPTPVSGQSYLLKDQNFGKCLGAQTPTLGKALTAEACNTLGTSQAFLFEMVLAGRYRLELDGYCVGPRGNDTSNGTKLELQTCNNSEMQLFEVRAQNQIHSVANGAMVVDIHGQNETDVILWTNAGYPNQRYDFQEP